MGTFISYNVTSKYRNYEIIHYMLTVFDEHLLEKINESTNGEYELNVEYKISVITMNRIKSILGNYAGVWTA